MNSSLVRQTVSQGTRCLSRNFFLLLYKVDEESRWRAFVMAQSAGTVNTLVLILSRLCQSILSPDIFVPYDGLSVFFSLIELQHTHTWEHRGPRVDSSLSWVMVDWPLMHRFLGHGISGCRQIGHFLLPFPVNLCSKWNRFPYLAPPLSDSVWLLRLASGWWSGSCYKVFKRSMGSMVDCQSNQDLCTGSRVFFSFKKDTPWLNLSLFVSMLLVLCSRCSVANRNGRKQILWNPFSMKLLKRRKRQKGVAGVGGLQLGGGAAQ